MRVVERADDGLRVTRMAVPLRDTEEENLLDHLEPCLHFIDEGRKVIASPGSPGAEDHCLWEQTRCIRHGRPVPHGSSGYGCRLSAYVEFFCTLPLFRLLYLKESYHSCLLKGTTSILKY
ncbi:unnamed protein product [Urochloa humidicola]